MSDTDADVRFEGLENVVGEVTLVRAADNATFTAIDLMYDYSVMINPPFARGRWESYPHEVPSRPSLLQVGLAGRSITVRAPRGGVFHSGTKFRLVRGARRHTSLLNEPTGLEDRLVAAEAEVYRLKAELKSAEAKISAALDERDAARTIAASARSAFAEDLNTLRDWHQKTEAANRNMAAGVREFERLKKYTIPSLERRLNTHEDTLAARDALLDEVADALFTGERRQRYYDAQALMRPWWRGLEKRRADEEWERDMGDDL